MQNPLITQLHAPAGANCLLLVLHGMGDSIKSYSRIGQEMGLGDGEFAIGLINAPLSFEDGYSWFPLNGAQEKYLKMARENIGELLRTSFRSFSRENIFILAHSQGAFLGLDLVIHSPQPFDGLIALAGYYTLNKARKNILETTRPETPIYHLHGTRDTIVRLTRANQDRRKLGAYLAYEWETLVQGHEITSHQLRRACDWIHRQIEKKNTPPWLQSYREKKYQASSSTALL